MVYCTNLFNVCVVCGGGNIHDSVVRWHLLPAVKQLYEGNARINQLHCVCVCVCVYVVCVCVYGVRVYVCGVLCVYMVCVCVCVLAYVLCACMLYVCRDVIQTAAEKHVVA